MSKKVLIVGGVAGGASAAARLRRLDENAQIIMFERDEYISFANCGLPYYIGETIKNRGKLLVQTPEAMNARFQIDVRIQSEVIQVDTVNKKVKVKSKEKGIYEESYDYLVLSPGAKALRPHIPGIDSKKILSLRNIPDTDRIKDLVNQEGIESAIVIGGGFIGVEMAENLRERGMEVALVEAAPHILAPFDSDMVVIAEKELTDNGVNLILGDGVKAFAEAGNQIEVVLNSDQKLKADMVILAIGVAPDTAFLKESGIELGPKGHILVDEKLKTNADGVYAVGDAIEVVDFITGQKTAIPLAGPANKQGRIVADNIAGLASTYKGTQGTSILKIFDLTAASTGANERTLNKVGIPYKAITVHPLSHASYYPGAVPMTLKLIFSEEGKILGAQGIGYEGVDKRIDVIATVIRLGGTVEDLTELELAYAPPFSSAKDPVNMAGYVAQNVLAGRSHLVTWDEVEELDPNDSILLDVRSEMEYENGHIPGAINIPVDDLRERLSELDPEKEIIEYCAVGLRGYVADRILSQYGYKVKNVTGGYKTIASRIDQRKEAQACGKQEANLKAADIGLDKTYDQSNLSKVTIDPDTQAVRKEEVDITEFDKAIDACGLACPGPLMQVKTEMDQLSQGQILKIEASDPGFYEDIQSWCQRTNNELVDLKKSASIVTAFIRKK